MRRATATAVLVLTASLGLSACSSDDSAEDTTGSSDSSASSSPSTGESPSEAATEDTESEDTGSGDDIAAADIPGLALGEGDFPAPYTFTPLPPGALEQGGDLVGGALAGATYDPAECGQAASATSGDDLSKSGVAVGADQTTGASVVEVVTPASVELPDFEELAKTCSSFTFTIDGPTGKLTGDASVEALPEPDVSADRAQAASTSVNVSVGGTEQTVVTTIYAAELRGVVVVVSGTSAQGSGVDTAVLDQLLQAGVDKVNAA